MKKVFLVAGLMYISAASFAQKGWSMNDQVSVGHSWTVGNKPENSDYKAHISYSIGRNAVYNFNENAGVGIGTFFSSEGVTMKNSNTDVETNLRSNYIRIPLTANFTFGDANKKVRPSLKVGPSVGFLVGGKYLNELDDTYQGGYKTTKAMNTKIDAGVNASLGLTTRITNGVYLHHDITYYHGLVEQKPNMPIGSSFTNRNLYLSAGFSVDCGAMKKWKGMMHNKHMF